MTETPMRRPGRLPPRGTRRRPARPAPCGTRRPAGGPARAGAAAARTHAPPAPMFFKKAGPVNGGFVATLLVLVVFGLLMLFSASTASGFLQVRRQLLLHPLPGAVCGAGPGDHGVASRVDYHWLRQFTWPLLRWCWCFWWWSLPLATQSTAAGGGCTGGRAPAHRAGEWRSQVLDDPARRICLKNTKADQGFVYGVLAPAVLLVRFWVLLVFQPHYPRPWS